MVQIFYIQEIRTFKK